jgi:transposase-like protein
MVEETFAPGMTVSLVARQHGVAPNQLFTWRRLVAQGSLTAPRRRIGRPPLPDEELVAQIKAGDRRIADPRLPARPRHPQAPGAGQVFKAA